MSADNDWIGSDYKSIFITNRIIKEVERELEQDPYDIKTWDVILQKVQSEEIEAVRILYEMLINQFPSYGRYWKCYIKHEMDSGNYQRVGKLFKRCFPRVMNIDLVEMFISCVKKSHFYSHLFSEKVAVTYKFGLERVGMDILSYPLWKDYINFLRRNSNRKNLFLMENHDLEIIGVEALGNPMNNIKELWEDYRSFETRDLIDLAANVYWGSFRVLGDYERLMEGLNRDAPPLLIQNLPEERTQVDRWRDYIAWEKSNPLNLKDTRVYYKRVMFAYKQRLSCLWHHPDVWIDVALYLEQEILERQLSTIHINELYKEITEIYDMAIDLALKNSMFLHFAYADFEEGRKNYDKVHSIYNKLINKDVDPTLTYIQYTKFVKRSRNNVSFTFLDKIQNDPRAKYHIHVAAKWIQLCERYLGHASKAFDDGLKQFNDKEGSNLARYLSSVTGDNIECFTQQNSISGGSPSQRLYDIREEFLKFERDFHVKDGRRPTLIAELKEYKGSKSAFLVDRYSFLDLVPCTVTELKSLGYPENLESNTVNSSK